MKKEDDFHRIFTEFVYNRSNAWKCDACPVADCKRDRCWIEVLTEDDSE